MNIVFHNFYQELNKNNFLFENDNVPGVGEGLLTPFKILKEVALSKGIKVGTYDFFAKGDTVDAFYFLDLPNSSDPIYQVAINSKKPMFLVLLESPIIRPRNYNKENHQFFKNVFTWSPDLIDNSGKYIRFFIPQNPKFVDSHIPFHRKKLLTMITSKKRSHLKNELYSEREQALDFFDLNYPKQFDLYGNGWDKDVYSGWLKILNITNRLNIDLPFRLQKSYQTYRGRVDSKLQTMAKYKFSICFENFGNAKGYITEKIFDGMLARTIPIYLGAPDILEFVPKDCFIDMRDFKTYSDLAEHLNAITESEYEEYLKRIDSFIKSYDARKFFPESFAENLLYIL